MTAQEPLPDPPGAFHIPVLLTEVVAGLQARQGHRHIDCTVGGGGHAAALLTASAPTGQLLGIDADPAAIHRVTKRLQSAVDSDRLHLRQGQFRALSQIAAETGFTAVDGILLDLGLSTFQLETAERGFAIRHDGPLDMRFDPDSETSADVIVNSWSDKALADLIYRYGEEHRSRRITRAIVANRPIHTTGELAAIVEKAVGGRRGRRIHPATKTFQALRIAVNDELQQLEETLPRCLELLRAGGRLAVISFHSLEDRIVKQWMRAEASDMIRDDVSPYGGVSREPTLRIITKRPIMADENERKINPQSRSARLRIAEKSAST